MKKVIRSVCFFSKQPSSEIGKKFSEIEKTLREAGYEILCLLKGLAEKYDKPLAARFVSDGKAQIGQRTNFQNPYLTDVQVRRL